MMENPLLSRGSWWSIAGREALLCSLGVMRMNAYYSVWGSSNNNLRGEHLLEFILESNPSIFNMGNTPTFVARAKQEVLDTTLGSPCLIDRIGN